MVNNVVDLNSYKEKQKSIEDLKEEIITRKNKIKLNYFEVFCILDNTLSYIESSIEDYKSNVDIMDLVAGEIFKDTINFSINVLSKFLKLFKQDDKFDTKVYKLNYINMHEIIFILQSRIYHLLDLKSNNNYDLDFIDGLRDEDIDQYSLGIYVSLSAAMESVEKELDNIGVDTTLHINNISVEEFFDDDIEKFFHTVFLIRKEHLFNIYERAKNRYIPEIYDFDYCKESLLSKAEKTLEYINTNEDIFKDVFEKKHKLNRLKRILE